MFSLGTAVPRVRGITYSNYLLPLAPNNGILYNVMHQDVNGKFKFRGPIVMFYQSGFLIESLKQWYNFCDADLDIVRSRIEENPNGVPELYAYNLTLKSVDVPVYLVSIELRKTDVVRKAIGRLFGDEFEFGASSSGKSHKGFCTPDVIEKYRMQMNYSTWKSMLTPYDFAVPLCLTDAFTSSSTACRYDPIGIPKAPRNMYGNATVSPAQYIIDPRIVYIV